MRKIMAGLITFLVVLTSISFSSDLYLLEIKSGKELKLVNSVVENARGTIDDNFIVDLSSHQVIRLQSEGIDLQLLLKNCNLEKIYLLLPQHKRKSKTAISIPSLHTNNDMHITELQKSSIDILVKEGYMIFPLSQKNTPFFFKPLLYPSMPLDEYPSDTIADLVSQDSLYSYVNRIEGFYSRFTPTDSCIAATYWIKNKFMELGYNDVFLDDFTVTSESQNIYNAPAFNVVCRKIGTVRPDVWIVIGGHLDSYNQELYTNPNAPAPGADDDASGVAATLELARLFKDMDLRKSYMFVGFGGEEQWMHGSDTMARELYENSVNVEFMLNMDMIAYEPEVEHYIDIYTTGLAYHDVFAGAASRLTNLITNYRVNAMWDADPFTDYGSYAITLHETHFNDPHYHKRHDSSTYLDFPYMEENVRMAAAALAIIDASVEPIACRLYDVGDGQSLRAIWDSCYDDYSYQIAYGDYTYNLTDTVEVPLSNCEYDITGLTEGEEYYVSVIGIPDEGYPPLGNLISIEMPLSIPRQPTGFTAEPDSACIVLNWDPSLELDISQYKLLRKQNNPDWSVVPDNISGNTYIDWAVESGETYQFCILAVDYDLNESDTSEIVFSSPATFDQGLLLVEETQSGGVNPSESEQTIFYQALLSGYSFSKVKIDSSDEALTRQTAGMYNPIFWVDDDNISHLLEGSLDSLNWFLNYNTDLLIAGWSTIYSMTGQTYFYPGDFFYDQLGISYIAENPLTDFTGATGINGWPDLELKPEAPGGGRMPNIDRFAATPESEVIYSFNSYSGNPAYNNKPVGVAIDTYHGKRVVLGFPLYWLTEASSQALVARVMDYFAEESILCGDVNGDWAINILDVTALIGYLYQGEEPPVDMNNGDPNGDCNINILDITYMISYLYKGGPAPVEGCVL